MGVMATYCQLCRLPVNQDHYVPRRTVFYLHRGRSHEDHGPAFAFGPEHDWLKQAVAVRRLEDLQAGIVDGVVHDGQLIAADGTRHQVFRGLSPEWAAVHLRCHEAADKPSRWAPRGMLPRRPELAPYCVQLFAFDRLADDGCADWLVDPSWPSAAGRANQQRIKEAAEIYLGIRPSPIPKLTDILRHGFHRGASTIEVTADAKPIYRRGTTIIANNFGDVPEDVLFGYVQTLLTLDQLYELDAETRVSTEVTFKNLGMLYLDVTVHDDALTARFTIPMQAV